jgi:nucleoredoxin
MALAALLGPKLITKDGEGDTATLLQGKGAIALYFSAHWCPPCQRFTPMLANWYSTSLKDKGLEVVFVSSDRDQKSYDEYYGEMPWLSVPYDAKAVKAALDKKFKVEGIPTIILLDSDGNLLNKDGRGAISNDPTGEDFPWRQKSFAELFSSAKLRSADGECSGSDLLGKKVFALYFSAHWCPPCRGFTPQLAEWYKNGLKDKGLEIVFVSSDKTEEQFDEYFGEMPWMALDYQDRKLKAQLSDLFGVQGIPSVVIIDADGSVISKDGRSAIASDPTGEEFPWYPKPVFNLKGGPGTIQEIPTVIAYCEGASPDDVKKIENAMTPLAAKFLADAKAAGDEEPEIGFAMLSEAGGIGGQLRQLMEMGEPSKEFQLMILDIPDEGGFYAGPVGEITEDVVGKLVEDYKSKALERKQLKRG